MSNLFLWGTIQEKNIYSLFLLKKYVHQAIQLVTVPICFFSLKNSHPEISGTIKVEWPHYFAAQVYFPTASSGLAFDLFWPIEHDINDVWAQKQASRSLLLLSPFSWDSSYHGSSLGYLPWGGKTTLKAKPQPTPQQCVCEPRWQEQKKCPWNPQNHEK